MNKLMKPVNNLVDKFLKNKTICIVLKIFLVLYAGLFAPKLPKQIMDILKHPISKTVVALLVVYLATKDMMLAILCAVVFILTIKLSNKLDKKENFQDQTQSLIDLNNLVKKDNEEKFKELNEVLNKSNERHEKNFLEIKDNIKSMTKTTDNRLKKLKKSQLKMIEQIKTIKDDLQKNKQIEQKKELEDISEITDNIENEDLMEEFSNKNNVEAFTNNKEYFTL